jgi:hypothetical protein
VARPTIVYILSRGHSGSTLLDLLLSSHPQIQSVGELKQIARREDPSCSCGVERVRECPFWTDVSERLVRRTGTPLLDQPIESDDIEAAQRANHTVYEEIAAAANTSVIVDSSKDHRRLEALLADDDFDVRVIHLVRSPEGVVFSHLRKQRDWRVELARYKRGLERSRRVLRGRAFRLVRYEALARHPERTVRELMTWLGLSFDECQLDWSGRVRHNVGGNRMRFSTSSEIRLDEGWRQLSLHQRAVIFSSTLGERIQTRWLAATRGR